MIWVQPSDQLIEEGDGLSLVVISAQQEVTYQWRRDGVPIEVATSSRFSLPKVGAKDSGATFDVVITEADGDQTVSRAAKISVERPPAELEPTDVRWATHLDWDKQKPGYEWLFSFIDTNQDGKVTQSEYTHYQNFKKKSNNWEVE
ncbi:MAG: immunoglobulin domain-containing protein, partial [Verrucomicrobiota bacterium]